MPVTQPARLRLVPRSLLALLSVLAFGLVLQPAGASAASGEARSDEHRGCRGANTAPTLENQAKARRATLCLVNRERTRRGRRALKRSLTLETVATKYSKRMVGQTFFDHVAPDGSTLTRRVQAAGYLRGNIRRWALGENIAWGTGDLATPKSVVQSWMKSPGHRRNILDNRFREAGFGVADGLPVANVDGEGAVYTNVFGERLRA